MTHSTVFTAHTPLASQIRRSFEELKARRADTLPSDIAKDEPALIEQTWDTLADLSCDSINSAANSAPLDGVYAAVVRSYRRGPRDVWAPVLLQMLAASLCERAEKLFSTIGTVSQEDIEQQLVLEVLRLAGRMAVKDRISFADGALVTEASKQVSRWLRRMNRRQHDSVYRHLEVTGTDSRDELDELNALCTAELPLDDLILVYRADVRGESLRRLALEHGLSEEAMSSRVRRLRKRLRHRLRGSAPQRASAA